MLNIIFKTRLYIWQYNFQFRQELLPYTLDSSVQKNMKLFSQHIEKAKEQQEGLRPRHSECSRSIFTHKSKCLSLGPFLRSFQVMILNNKTYTNSHLVKSGSNHSRVKRLGVIFGALKYIFWRETLHYYFVHEKNCPNAAAIKMKTKNLINKISDSVFERKFHF